MVLHLVETAAERDPERILLGVDHPGLQGGVDFTESYRHGARPEHAEGFDLDRNLADTDFHAGHILRLPDDPAFCRDMARRPVHPGEHPDALIVENRLAERLADLAFDDLFQVLRRDDQIGRVEHAIFGRNR